MYFEFDRNNTKREGWTFTYKGSELIVNARIALNKYERYENEARRKLSDLSLDTSISTSSSKTVEARSNLDTVAKRHEQLKVWIHEFQRTPDREFHLSLGDVVFFELSEAKMVEEAAQ